MGDFAGGLLLARELIPPGSTVLCAVSGGADSVCLLHQLYRLRREVPFTLAAAHYNHQLRGEEADRDAAFVRTRAQDGALLASNPRGGAPELTIRAAFSCEDERLNAIYDVSARTMELCTREFFLDGIKRDRWVWSGDAYQSYMVNIYLFFD